MRIEAIDDWNIDQLYAEIPRKCPDCDKRFLESYGDCFESALVKNKVFCSYNCRESFDDHIRDDINFFEEDYNINLKGKNV